MAKSRVAKAKEEMMWQKKCPNCGNCKHFTSDLEEIEGCNGSSWAREINKRCSEGNFATGKSNWCPGHEFK